MAAPLVPFTLSFQNEHIIFERTVKCTVKDYEFNYSYNRTLLQSGSNQNVVSFATGSDFKPYVTSVGFYNDRNELLMVAKLSQPLPLPTETDLNLMVRIDI